MKSTTSLLIGFLLLFASGYVYCAGSAGEKSDSQQATTSIMCSPDLQTITSKWANEYNRLYPAVNIKISTSGFSNSNLDKGESLTFVSGRDESAIHKTANWKLVVGRNIIVPVMNSGNPYYKVIYTQGISEKNLVLLLNHPDERNWGTLLANDQNEPIHIYIVNDETVKYSLSKLLEKSQVQFTAITFGTSDEVISAVQNDPLAIGLTNILSIQTSENRGLAAKLQFLPIDKNGNGSLDYMENIYADLNTFERGVWIGKFPKAFVNNVFAVSNLQPVAENELAFLKWVITDGQQFMNANGFSEMVSSESQSQLDKLTIASVDVTPVRNNSKTGMVLLIVAIVLISGLLISALVRNYRRQKTVAPDFNTLPAGFAEESIVLPHGLYFDKSHTWSFMEKNGNITVGIDDFLQHITGPISRIEMKNPGEKIKKGDVLMSIIQVGKQLSIYSPFTGTIKKQNDALLSDTSLLNSSPYEKGWIYSIEPANWFKEIQLLDMSEKYRKWLDAEFLRFKDFLAAILNPGSPEYAHVVLQDGGELKEGVLSDFGPEVWDDFQSNFLDTFK